MLEFIPASTLGSSFAQDGILGDWPRPRPLGPVILDNRVVYASTVRTDNTPINVLPQRTNAVVYRPEFFWDIFYSRIIVEPPTLDLGNLVSDQVREFTIFNAYFFPRVLSGITLEDVEGVSFSGITLPINMGALETYTIELTILADGPSTIDGKLIFDFIGTGDDFTIELKGSRLVAIPFQAEAPMDEQLAWKTNILTTINNREQRVRVRNSPRQTVSTNYPISKEHGALANNLAHGWQFRKWSVPLWHEVQQVGDIVAGDTTVDCDTDIYDIRESGTVMIWESPTHNEIAIVESAFLSSITLARGVVGDFKSPLLMPARLCRNLGGIARDTTGFQSSMLIKFESLDNVVIASTPPPQYQNEDIYLNTELLLSSESNRHAIRARVDTVDFGASTPEYDSPWSNTIATMPYVVINEGPRENWEFKQFLHRRAGRLRPFWIQTYEDDFEVVPGQGLITGGLDVKENSYRKLTPHRNQVAILFDSGVWVAYEITGTSSIPNNVTAFTIALSPVLNIEASTIKQVSFLDLVRLDSDSVTLRWLGNGVSTCEINVKQIEAVT